MHKHSVDEALAAFAGKQHGVVSSRQLRALGMGRGAVHGRVAAGRLHRLLPGVYAVGHTALTERSRLLAAALACGQGAVLSHRSAGRLWGLVKPVPAVDVTCRRSRPPGKGIVVYRSRLERNERTMFEKLPVTGVARTIVDLADVLTEPRLEDAVHEAEVRRVFDLAAIEATLARHPGRKGRFRLYRVLSAWRPQPFTRSEAERRFLRLCEHQGLPRPEVNAFIYGMEVDFVWPAARLVVEVDGAAVHHTRRAFERDRRRDRELAAHGLRVLRVTWHDLEQGGLLALELDAALRGRPLLASTGRAQVQDQPRLQARSRPAEGA